MKVAGGGQGLTWQAFRDHLEAADGAGRVPSYGAIQNYHTYTRTGAAMNDGTSRVPPADYLQRVCDVFGVRSEWLLFGTGEPTREAEAARVEGVMEAVDPDKIDEVVRRRLPTLADLPAGVRIPLWEMARRVVLQRHVRGPGADTGPFIELEDAELTPEKVGRAVADFVTAPLEQFGIDPDAIGQWQWAHYLAGLQRALEAVTLNGAPSTGAFNPPPETSEDS